MRKFIKGFGSDHRGMTMVELMITTVVFGIVLAVLNTLFFSSNTMYAKTNERVGLQMNGRTGLSIMTTELRQAGCDPTDIGLQGLLTAAADTIRVQADVNGDGAISTAEPSENVTYFFDPATQTLNRNPGSGAAVLVPNVTNAVFSYLDAANNPLGPLPLTANQANRVQTVTVTMTTTSQRVGDITLTTSISLRNN
jgi:type IV pilus assembly protein PilW